MAVTLSVGKAWADLAAATRMLDRFDAYCVVTGAQDAVAAATSAASST